MVCSADNCKYCTSNNNNNGWLLFMSLVINWNHFPRVWWLLNRLTGYERYRCIGQPRTTSRQNCAHFRNEKSHKCKLLPYHDRHKQIRKRLILPQCLHDYHIRSDRSSDWLTDCRQKVQLTWRDHLYIVNSVNYNSHHLITRWCCWYLNNLCRMWSSMTQSSPQFQISKDRELFKGLIYNSLITIQFRTLTT